MKVRYLALAVVTAGLAGCAADPAAKPPGPAYLTEMNEGRPGLFGDLTWNIDNSGKKETIRAAEEEEFKRWKESQGADRREFEEWRAWQEWKRQNPK